MTGKITMTNHAKVDRADRIIAINCKIGLGEKVIASYYQQETGCYRCLTETGCILIRSGSVDGCLVTAFCATMKQAKDFYRDTRMPNWLYARVTKNQKYKELFF